MKTVLITGCAGFLGSNLARHHLEAGDRVVGFDDHCSSNPSSAHLRELHGFERFHLFEQDICELKGFDVLLDVGAPDKVDVVYNMACPASPPAYQAMPVHTMMTCVVGTANMLALAMTYKAVFVQASTSEVYGDPECSVQHEGYRGSVNCYGPRACYDEGKRAAEALCWDYRRTHGADARLVRIFNTYGPNMDPNDGRVVSNFICQALKHEKLTVYGTGAQTRSFCYVDDLIRGIMATGALPENPGTPINLGNPNEFTVRELADLVLEHVGADPSMLINRPLPVDDPRQRCPDISRARELLGWEPKVQLREGLGRTVAYFRSIVR